MKRFLFPLIFSALLSFTAVAQDPDLFKKGVFSNSPKENWFVSLGGGVQAYYGSEDFTYFVAENLSPAVDLSFGKWLTPSVAFRVQFDGLLGKGWSTTETPYHISITKGLIFEQFYYGSAHFDLMWSVLDIWEHYRVSRIFKLIPFVGAGIVSTFPSANSTSSIFSDGEFGVGAAAGFIFNFRVAEHLSFNLELRSIFSDGGNDKAYYPEISPMIEFMNSASLALQYEIAPAKFVRKYEMDAQYRYEMEQLQHSVNTLLKQKSLLEEQNNELNQKLYEYLTK